MDTTEDKLVALMPSKLFDACLRALSLADAKVRAGSSRTCSILIDGNKSFSKRHYLSAPKQKIRMICWMGRCVLTQLAIE